MILYVRNMSPLKRRVAIWCRLQGRELKWRKLMVIGEDFEKLKRINLVGRAPVLDDCAALIEISAIIDWLEETAPGGSRLLPIEDVARRDALQLIAYANSTVERGVALAYDKNLRPKEQHWPEWASRLEEQIGGGLAALEKHAQEAGWFGGEAPAGPDIAFVIAHDFAAATNPQLIGGKFPKLAAMAARAQMIPAFAETMPET